MSGTDLVGTVVAVQANFYLVSFESDYHNLEEKARENLADSLLCTRRSRLKKIGQKVMVGDRVVVEEPDWAGGRGAIAQVLPRQTVLTRPPIANADGILLMFALAEPDLDPLVLSRFLVKAESTGLGVTLCLNKCDLATEEEILHWRDRLSAWGYEPFFISVKSDIGICEKGPYNSASLAVELSLGPARIATAMLPKPSAREKKSLGPARIATAMLPKPSAREKKSLGPARIATAMLPKPSAREKNKITVVSGSSGVGKSSLINRLIPELDLRVGEVSGKLARGRHTTRHVELFQLPMGGLLADSPGFNQPQLECEPQESIYLFPEGRERLAAGNCQFSDCLHRSEPNCVVRGEWERYEYYLMFLEEAIARQEALQQQPDGESSLKAKTKAGGKRKLEPRLESKKYRRSSRRVEHQKLQELCDELDEW